MGDRYDDVCADLRARPRRWLVTGAAGFIGSHLVQELLELGQTVRGLDDLSTGRTANLDDVRDVVGDEAWSRFTLTRGDVAVPEVANAACADVDLVLHQAALGSVPRSIADPLRTFHANVAGTATMLEAARTQGVTRFVFASSSSVYGDSPILPRLEGEEGEPLSPYALSKGIGEQYAATYHRVYRLSTVGLRYFNVFGPRQDPEGPYAAVLPRWIRTLLRGERPVIHGDGMTSRDFCPVANVVAANLLAATAGDEVGGMVCNVGLGGAVDLALALAEVRACLLELGHPTSHLEERFGPVREGDVPHSRADTFRARKRIGFSTRIGFRDGLRETVAWYVSGSAPP